MSTTVGLGSVILVACAGAMVTLYRRHRTRLHRALMIGSIVAVALSAAGITTTAVVAALMPSGSTRPRVTPARPPGAYLEVVNCSTPVTTAGPVSELLCTAGN